jgi:hypothetical protein
VTSFSLTHKPRVSLTCPTRKRVLIIKNTKSTTRILNFRGPINGFMLTRSLPIHRWQVNIRRDTHLWRTTLPDFSNGDASSGETYTLFSGNRRPFPEYLAPDLPSPPLNPFPSSISSPLKMKGYHIMGSLLPLHTRQNRLYLDL